METQAGDIVLAGTEVNAGILNATNGKVFNADGSLSLKDIRQQKVYDDKLYFKKG